MSLPQCGDRFYYSRIFLWCHHAVSSKLSTLDLANTDFCRQLHYNVTCVIMTSQDVDANMSSYFLPFIAFSFLFLHILQVGEKQSITSLWEGLGNPILVSMICNINDSASLVVDCKSWTLGWDFLVPPATW